METKEIVDYIEKRKELLDQYAQVMMLKQVAEPHRSVDYGVKAAMSKASSTVLDHILYYIENGTEHPDLIAPVQSEEKTEEPIVEEKPAPKPRGRKPKAQ